MMAVTVRGRTLTRVPLGSGRPWAAMTLSLAVTLGAVACSDDSEDSDEAAVANGEEADPETGDEASAAGDADADADESAAATGPPVPSAGCEGAALPEADLDEDTMDVAGEERRFLLSAPAWDEGDDPLPLLVDFHGLAEGADVHAEMTQLGPLGIGEGFISVFPHGTGEPVAWQTAPDLDDNDDLVFVGDMLDRLEAEHCVDTSRVYAMGLSNGAMMTSTVACTMPERFAAVAPIAGVAMPDPCERDRPVPMQTAHGTADQILRYDGGVDSAALESALGGGDDNTTTTAATDLDGDGYPETVREWAELNGCGDSEDERVTDEVLLRAFDCPDGADVEFFIVEGGGHSWPSSEFSRSVEAAVGHTTFDIDASEEAWEFFKRFQLPPS